VPKSTSYKSYSYIKIKRIIIIT